MTQTEVVTTDSAMLQPWKKVEGSDRITILALAIFCLIALVGLFLIR